MADQFFEELEQKDALALADLLRYEVLALKTRNRELRQELESTSKELANAERDILALQRELDMINAKAWSETRESRVSGRASGH